MIKVDSWPILVELAKKVLEKNGLGSEYSDRLDFEIKEIEKQGANRYWLSVFNSKKKFKDNKNGLVLPFLLGVTKIDPIKKKWSYIVQEDGDKADAIELMLEDDSHITVFASSIIATKRGNIRALELRVGDELC